MNDLEKQIDCIFKTPSGGILRMKNGRAIVVHESNVTVLSSIEDYHTNYAGPRSPITTWTELRSDAEKSDFLKLNETALNGVNWSAVEAKAAASENFRIGRVFDRAPSLYFQNFLKFTIVMLIATAPTLLFTNATGDTSGEPAWFGSVASVLTGLFLWFVLRLVGQAMLVYGAFQSLRGKPVSLVDSFGVVLREFFSLIGLTIITAIGVLVGSMFFVIPGLMLYTAWFVAVPVCMVERLGALESLSRSSDLTRGNRWPIFGVILLLNVGISIVSKIIEVTFAALGGSVAVGIGLLVGNAILEALFAVFVIVTYYELRVAKEGIDVEQIASVFD